MLTVGVHRLRASGCIPGALDLSASSLATDLTGTIFVVATSLPIDVNRQIRTLRDQAAINKWLQGQHPERYEDGQLRTLQASCEALAGRPRSGARDRARTAASRRRSGADRLHPRDGAGGDDRRAGVHAPVVRVRAAVFELGVGDDLPVGVDGGAAQGRAASGVPPGTRAALPPDRRLDGGDASHSGPSRSSSASQR